LVAGRRPHFEQVSARPSLQTRYQARKLVARLRRAMSAEWMRERDVGVQQGRFL
jgi:hypothetical protein